MALLKLELLARVLLASGIPVMEAVKGAKKVYSHVRITPALRIYLVKNDRYLLYQNAGFVPEMHSAHDELCLAIGELRDLIDDFAPAFTRVRLEGERYQPDFAQMDHAEIVAWRLEEIGYDWISDEPDISLEEFQENMQDYWEEMMQAEAEANAEGDDVGQGEGHIYA